MVRDFSITPTTSYATVASLLTDSDAPDISNNLRNVTVTNNTNVTLTIKNTGKGSAPSGSGRQLASGESFNYLEVLLSQMYVKVAGTPSGSVMFTGYQN